MLGILVPKNALFWYYYSICNGVWLLVTTAFALDFWTLVIGVAIYVSGIAMITSNAMAVILDNYPHIAGTVSSLAGTIRFSIGALVGTLLSLIPAQSAWPMVGSMVACVAFSMLFVLLAKNKVSRMFSSFKDEAENT